MTTATYPATKASLKRAAERQYAAAPRDHTGFGALDILGAIARDPNVSPVFAARLSEVKVEEIAADARGEDLWLLRGGSPE